MYVNCVDLEQDYESLKDGQVVDLFVVDLGFLEFEIMNIDVMGGEVLVFEFVGDFRLNLE